MNQFKSLDFDHPPADPIALLNQWIAEADDIGLPNPNAMALATVDADGRPSARMVLLKGLDERGAVFFTNYNSRKGLALAVKPLAALLFHWDPMNRQVRVEGAVTPTSDAEADAYFATRPRQSQIGAWASRQSEAAKNRAELDAAFAEQEKRFEGKPVFRPPHWGGFRVRLEAIEFWQGHMFRLHDRIVYRPEAQKPGVWRVQRLFP